MIKCQKFALKCEQTSHCNISCFCYLYGTLFQKKKVDICSICKLEFGKNESLLFYLTNNFIFIFISKYILKVLKKSTEGIGVQGFKPCVLFKMICVSILHFY